jgi:hypothetical protein
MSSESSLSSEPEPVGLALTSRGAMTLGCLGALSTRPVRSTSGTCESHVGQRSGGASKTVPQKQATVQLMARLQLIGCGGARDEVRLRPLAEPGVQAINLALSTTGAVVT